MIKDIEINGQTIRLKATIFSQIIYKQQFGKDMNAQFSKIAKLSKKLIKLRDLMQSEEKGEESSDGDESELDRITEEISTISTNVQMEYYRIFWAYARAADKSLPDFDSWIESMDLDDIALIAATVSELATGSNRIDRKNV